MQIFGKFSLKKSLVNKVSHEFHLEICFLYFHFPVSILVFCFKSLFDEKLRERKDPKLALDKGITECRKFEFVIC